MLDLSARRSRRLTSSGEAGFQACPFALKGRSPKIFEMVDLPERQSRRLTSGGEGGFRLPITSNLLTLFTVDSNYCLE